MKPDRADMLILLGGACLVAGAAWIYRPAGFLMAGLVLVFFGYSMAASKE